MLGGGDPVGVDGSMWRGSGSPFQRVMNWAATVVQLSISAAIPGASRLRARTARRRTAPSPTRGPTAHARFVVDVQQRLKAPHRRQHGQAGLHVDAHVAGVHRQLAPLRRRQARAELAVHQ